MSSLRGSCQCGAVRFTLAQAALGAIDGPTGIQLERHIFVAEKGDYYTIADGLPQNER